MGSLKALTKTMAGALGLTPDALYERQRVLVSLNLLKPEKGRGPGSGVRATPKTVALLLISVLAANGLSDVAASAAAIAGSKLTGRKRGPFDQDATFVDALEWALSSPTNANSVASVSVSHGRAYIHFTRSKPKLVSFGDVEFSADLEFGVRLRGAALKRIAESLDELNDGALDAR